MAVWNGVRVPFTMLGGYLGAGKTTIINHVVANARGRRIVVLVNDIGAVDVDGALIADHDGTTLSLTNGCVCCAIADDFAQTLERIRAMPEPPDHVLMELSGVGEPARVAPWAGTAGFRLDAIVVVADADQIVELAAREYVGDTIGEQLRSADLVVLTKTDLAVDAGSAARSLIARQTRAPIIDVRDGVVDVDVVLGADRGDVGLPTASHRVDVDVVLGADRGDVGLPTASHRVGGYDTAVVEIGAPTRVELEQLLAALPTDVVRAKGLVQCSDVEVPVEAHVVGSRRTVRRRPDLDMSRAVNRLVTIRVSGGAGRIR